jgi:hypothetical protein
MISFDQILIDVWRQVLVENVTVVVLDKKRYDVRQTSKRHLREVTFAVDRIEIRGLEQNPDTKSRWAEMARAGEKVMQFISEGRYLANVVGGKLTMYGRDPGEAGKTNLNHRSLSVRGSGESLNLISKKCQLICLGHD